jgi:hypothetical protein
MISINTSQLQFLLKKPPKTMFKKRINTIERRPQGNNKKLEASLRGWVAMVICLERKLCIFFEKQFPSSPAWQTILNQ